LKYQAYLRKNGSTSFELPAITNKCHTDYITLCCTMTVTVLIICISRTLSLFYTVQLQSLRNQIQFELIWNNRKETRWLQWNAIESRTCVVARTYSSFGDRAFAAAGPVLWNSLPSHLKEADLPYSQFWRSLKTFLFG